MKETTDNLDMIFPLVGEIQRILNVISVEQSDDYQLSELAKFTKKLKVARDLTKDISTQIYEMYERMAKHTLPELMESQGFDLMKVAGVGTVQMRDDIYVSVTSKKDLHEWLIDNGKEHLISETVNASALKSAIKQHLLETGSTPDCVEVTPYSFVVITK